MANIVEADSTTICFRGIHVLSLTACTVETTEVRIASVELGKDAGGKHMDTRVVFMQTGVKLSVTSTIPRSLFL